MADWNELEKAQLSRWVDERDATIAELRAELETEVKRRRIDVAKRDRIIEIYEADLAEAVEVERLTGERDVSRCGWSGAAKLKMEAQAEVERLREQLARYEVTPGLAAEYHRLDAQWQRLVRDRDDQRRRAERSEADLAEAVEVVRDCEWRNVAANEDGKGYPYCFCCFAPRPSHKPDCRAAALLAKVRI